MTEHEQNLRDLAAMFAMAALLVKDRYNSLLHEEAFNIADAFMAARQVEPTADEGIAAIKPTRKRKEPE